MLWIEFKAPDRFLNVTASKLCKVKFYLVIYHLFSTGLGQRIKVRARWAVWESDCGLDDPAYLIWCFPTAQGSQGVWWKFPLNPGCRFYMQMSGKTLSWYSYSLCLWYLCTYAPTSDAGTFNWATDLFHGTHFKLSWQENHIRELIRVMKAAFYLSHASEPACTITRVPALADINGTQPLLMLSVSPVIDKLRCLPWERPFSRWFKDV